MSYVPAGLDVRKVIAAVNLLASEKDDRLDARSTAMLDPPKYRPPQLSAESAFIVFRPAASGAVSHRSMSSDPA
jgi:hypothetical protein